MVTRAQKFTPEVLLSATRRSSAIPNSDGSQFLTTSRSWSFKEHKWIKQEVRVLDASSGDSSLVTDLEGASEPQWLGDNHVLVLAPADKEKHPGGTSVYVGSLSKWDEDHYNAGTIDGSASNLRIKRRHNGSYLFAISAEAKPDGSMYNAEKEKKRTNSGKVYNKQFVRHWDTWMTPNRSAIWYGQLKKDSESHKYELSELINALKETGLESPIPTFGGTDHFDVSENGIVFVAKDPELNPAINTKCNVYLMTHADFDGTKTLPKPYLVHINGYDGAATSPVFSADGMQVAFLQMTQNGYESDRNEIFTIPDIRRPSYVNHLVGFPELKQMWDVSPSSVVWSHDGKGLYVQAEHHGTNCLWTLSADYLHLGAIPTKVFGKGSVSGKFKSVQKPNPTS